LYPAGMIPVHFGPQGLKFALVLFPLLLLGALVERGQAGLDTILDDIHHRFPQPGGQKRQVFAEMSFQSTDNRLFVHHGYAASPGPVASVCPTRWSQAAVAGRFTRRLPPTRIVHCERKPSLSVSLQNRSVRSQIPVLCAKAEKLVRSASVV